MGDLSKDAHSLDELKAATRRQGSFLQTVSAVLWSFFGVRRANAHQADAAELNPIHVIIVGIGAGVLFVVGLLALVRVVIS